MKELTGKQKRFLRGLGQGLTCTAAVGKAGVSRGLAEDVRRQLDTRELLKVRLPAGPQPQRRRAADELAGAAGAECVGIIGRTGILFRPNEAIGQDARIALPPTQPGR